MPKKKDLLAELRRFSAEKISDKIKADSKHLVELEQKKMLGSLKNVRELSAVKRSIARAKTILKEKLIENA